MILCLSASVLQLHEVHFTGDVALFLVVVLQVTLSGSVLVHSGRKPSLFWVSGPTPHRTTTEPPLTHTHTLAAGPEVELLHPAPPLVPPALLSSSAQVKCVLVLHLISAAFATAALGLMSKHLPYRQDSYHCEHCRRLEQHAVVLTRTARLNQPQDSAPARAGLGAPGPRTRSSRTL